MVSEDTRERQAAVAPMTNAALERMAIGDAKEQAAAGRTLKPAGAHGGADRAPPRGTLFLVVGPSGVGKDTLIDGARARLGSEAAFHFVRRVVTRPAGAIGEDHEPMEEAAFARAEAAGAFAVVWRAHGLAYGIRREAIEALAAGRNVIVNASRGSIADFRRVAGAPVVLSITAPAEIVRERLAARGREDAEAVAARLTRTIALPDAGTVVDIRNDASVEAGVERLVSALLGGAVLPLRLVEAPLDMPDEPLCVIHEEALLMKGRQLAGAARVEVTAPGGRAIRARLARASGEHFLGRDEVALSTGAITRLGAAEGTLLLVRRAPRPPSRDLLRRKIAGAELSPIEIGRVVEDVVDGHYALPEIAGFLVAASVNLSVAEVAALTAARAGLFERIDWGGRLVADKHSMGGVPGGRITLVAVPIAVAHGLLVPKTSSRAITSAAGSADVMECVARVDLSPADLRRTVEAAGGAVAWSGRISHGPFDDVMNAINRPLGIRSAPLDVSSILSKKLVAGATNVIVDVPFGHGTKMRARADADALARLFETVGRRVGLAVEAVVTEGARPLGRGVGPALELADVTAALAGAPEASRELVEKALAFAATMIEWDPAVERGTGRARARELLASGAALAAFERMVDAQGRRPPVPPGAFTRDVPADRAGVLAAFDGFALGGVARTAGAPGDKGAGIVLRAGVGRRMEAGEPLLTIVSGTADGLARAASVRAADVATLA